MNRTYVDNNGVSSIRASSDASANGIVAGQNVHQLSLAFVAPLRAQDHIDTAAPVQCPAGWRTGSHGFLSEFATGRVVSYVLSELGCSICKLASQLLHRRFKFCSLLEPSFNGRPYEWVFLYVIILCGHVILLRAVQGTEGLHGTSEENRPFITWNTTEYKGLEHTTNVPNAVATAMLPSNGLIALELAEVYAAPHNKLRVKSSTH